MPRRLSRTAKICFRCMYQGLRLLWRPKERTAPGLAEPYGADAKASVPDGAAGPGCPIPKGAHKGKPCACHCQLVCIGRHKIHKWLNHFGSSLFHASNVTCRTLAVVATHALCGAIVEQWRKNIMCVLFNHRTDKTMQ